MDESMKAAITAAKEEGKAASRLYNVPIETLCRRVTSSVDVNCRPGPPTILTSEEEDKLAEYCVEMVDRGFGLDVMRFANCREDKESLPIPEWYGWVWLGRK